MGWQLSLRVSAGNGQTIQGKTEKRLMKGKIIEVWSVLAGLTKDRAAFRGLAATRRRGGPQGEGAWVLSESSES